MLDQSLARPEPRGGSDPRRGRVEKRCWTAERPCSSKGFLGENTAWSKDSAGEKVTLVQRLGLPISTIRISSIVRSNIMHVRAGEALAAGGPHPD